MDTKNITFNVEKMKEFAKRDALIRFASNDLQRRGDDEVYALEVTFNSYVLNDFTMERIYLSL